MGSGKKKGKGLSKSVVAGKVPQTVIPLVTSQNSPARGKRTVVFTHLLVHLWFSTWGDSSPGMYDCQELTERNMILMGGGQGCC